VATKLVYVCLDGLGDDPIEAFDGRTPLEAAATPNLDALAARGRTGTVITVGPGIAPESDIGVFGILGYDPKDEHPGRGVLESIGVGMEVRDGDLAYRVNFATADWPAIVDRRVGRSLSSEEASLLVDHVMASFTLPGATFELRGAKEHRGALVIRTADGSPLSAAVTNTDPAYRREGNLGVAVETFDPVVVHAEAFEDAEPARRAAELTNVFVEGTARLLDADDVNVRRRSEGKLPANLILTRDAGDHRPHLEPIAERFAMRWGCFVEMPVERGIALALGMEEVPAPESDGRGFGTAAEDAYAAWARLAAEAIGEFDALYVHLKGPDVPAHDGRADDKRDVIAAIDAAFFGELLPRIDPSRTIVAVTADHATSCPRRAHTADPVPLVVSGDGVTPDGSTVYGEGACADGSIGQLLGRQILPRIAQLVGN
jgi:2,3-bisphosphoglycerate-independent phosphoglycerate mutase